MDAARVTATPPPRRRPLSAVLALTFVTLLAIGLLGLRQYVDAYAVYRGFPPPVRHGAAQGVVRTEHLDSPALGRTAAYAVYTPPGYATAARASRRFPVLYLLHAPPGSPTGYLTIGALAVRMDELIAADRIRPFLVVIPDGHTSVDGNDTEWANGGAGRYEQFVLDTVHAVDQRYATVPARGARAIAGLSEGGYGATNVTLHHLRDFGTFESWSGYFTADPGPTWSGFSAAQMAANSPRFYVTALAPQLRRLPTAAFLYRGTRDRITSSADMRAFATRFREAGGHVATAEYPGTHSWSLWRDHIPQMLRFASAHFTTAADHPRGGLR